MPRIPKRREGMPYLISEDQHIEILQEVTTIYLEYYRDDLLVQADGVPLGGMTYDNLVGRRQPCLPQGPGRRRRYSRQGSRPRHGLRDHVRQ